MTTKIVIFKRSFTCNLLNFFPRSFIVLKQQEWDDLREVEYLIPKQLQEV